MLAALTGVGLSASAGLNAYIPLLLVGLVARYTDILPLTPAWQWLEHPVTLVTLGALLVVELVADKIPAVDHVNDLVQTVVRPTSGGITFGAGTSAHTVADAGDTALWPVASGIVVALVFHLVKMLARPVVNTMTLGVGGPVVSTVEDASSLVIALVAILVPVLVLLLVPCLVVLVIRVRRWRRRRSGDVPT